MLLYGFCDAIILYDTHNALSMLCEEARHLLAMYQPELQEVQGIRYWLASVRVKLRAALNAGNLTKAAFVSTTASWPLMQGLWMVNRLPIPPGGAALAYLSRLQQLPPRFQEQFQLLLMGDGHHRIHATVDLLDWVLDQFAELPD
jgi:hypothetical protein